MKGVLVVCGIKGGSCHQLLIPSVFNEHFDQSTMASYDVSGWPTNADIAEQLREVDSMSRYMAWAQDEATKKGLNPQGLKAFCGIGVDVATRNEAESACVMVWAPELSDEVHKVWCVQALENYLATHADPTPFFFSVTETTTTAGKQYFQIKCQKVDPSTAAKFPPHIIERMEEQNDMGNDVHAELLKNRQRERSAFTKKRKY